MLKLEQLPYTENSSFYFEKIRHLDWPIWLDSGKPSQPRGRYDILSADPLYKIHSKNDITTVFDKDNTTTKHTSVWSALKYNLDLIKPPITGVDLPFTGGAMGYIGYDAGRKIEHLNDLITDDINLPESQLGIYTWALIQDHHKKITTLIAQPAVTDLEFEKLKKALKEKSNSQSQTFKTGSTKHQITPHQYAAAIEKIKHYITSGDCYQVNFSQRFDTSFSGDPFIAYLKLREQLPAQYSCYFETDSSHLLSLSPECFIQAGPLGQIVTRPIKGTRPRGASTVEDQELALGLLNSAKDKAENLMIVDLLRNDLSKVCEPHSVKTQKLFELESYANVHHLVSTIEGKLSTENSTLDAIKAAFPGGSITGAPKIRAMEIIEELEVSRRSVYCGSVGYISADGQADMNIAIRTLHCNQDMMYCWGGGGIVADSDTEQEYQESLNKVGLILNTLKQFKPT
jgi:para-aminobenzoate synthetase component 1